MDVDLVLIAMGFAGPIRNGMIEQLGVRLDPRGNVATDQNNMTSVPGIFAAGDMRRGQSLVVWAIAEGRKTAASVDAYFRTGSDAHERSCRDGACPVSRRKLAAARGDAAMRFSTGEAGYFPQPSNSRAADSITADSSSSAFDTRTISVSASAYLFCSMPSRTPGTVFTPYPV